MDEDKKARLKTVAEDVRELRRKYNNILNDVIEGKIEEYNGEDLVRLVGTLEALYNHLLASIASDGDLYCIEKHTAYAIILVGELEKPDVEPLYDIMAVISNGRIEPCSACKQEEDNKKGEQYGDAEANQNIKDD